MKRYLKGDIIQGLAVAKTLFTASPSSEEARMAGGCSSNTANRANYHRITGESEIGK